MKISLQDIIDPDIKFSIVEDNSDVDGEHILARVRGQFFVPNGKSRNGRFYPEKLWERVISDKDVKRRLESRLMFGALGHDAKLDDQGLREGNASHIMVDLSINENKQGIGEALILNTPTGRILNTVLRAGSKLCVSSRANGTFKGKNSDGLPVVDESTYDMKGFDFVIDPGFLEANPTIAESLQNIEEGDEMQNDKTVNQTLVEHIANENADLKNRLGTLTDEVNTLKEDKVTLKEENDHVKAELGTLEETNKKVAAFEKIGTVEEIEEKLKKADENNTVLEAYGELADSPEDAKAALERSRDFIKTVTEDFGSVEEIREALEGALEFNEKVEELGGLENITKALQEFDKVLTANEEAEKEAEVKALATELKLSEEKVKDLLERHTAEEIKSLYKELAESATSDRYKKTNFNEDTQKDVDAPESDVSESSILGKSRVDRINERFAK